MKDTDDADCFGFSIGHNDKAQNHWTFPSGMKWNEHEWTNTVLLIHANFVGPEPHVWPIPIYQSMMWITPPSRSSKKRSRRGRESPDQRGRIRLCLPGELTGSDARNGWFSSCENIAIEKATHQINGGVFIGKASINGGLSVATVGYQRVCSWLLVEGPTPKSQMFQVEEWRSLDAFDILQSW